MNPTPSLLKFQIGPVQDFIAAARSTRDLWSGSYLLSWLAAAGIKALPTDAQLIFPSKASSNGEQPLLASELDPGHPDVLIPNLPNLFIAEISGDAEETAKAVTKAIKDEWEKIADSVWGEAGKFGIPEDKKEAFNRSVDNHLSISWQATPLTDGGYTEAYRNNGWHLDAVRQAREFRAWSGGKVQTGVEKDSLTGKEEALCGGREFQEAMAQKNGELFSLFKHSDEVGAITLVKRIWHITHLRPQGLKTKTGEFKIRSIPAIAARQGKLDDDRSADEGSSGDNYIAAIAFDGDSIGAWINGDKSPDDTDTGLRRHHADFSQALSNFALGKAREIVEGAEDQKMAGTWKGQLIYAGGDDVVCLVPANAALEVAAGLRKAFCEATQDTPSKGTPPDASAGIAIGHIHAPLQDLVREAQHAEKRAKNEVGRPAFSVTLMKRSGEISHWGSKWDSGGLALYEAIATALDERKLSRKFPHRVCQLIEPYLVSQTALMKEQKAMQDTADFNASEIIEKEFAFAISRQSEQAAPKENDEHLMPLLKTYLGKLPDDPQDRLTSLVGLCTTVAFAHRTQPETAEKQSS